MRENRRKRIQRKYIIRRRVAMSIIAICMIMVSIFAVSAVSADADKAQSTCTITVCSGDTLWDIARSINTASMDVRNIVDDIIRLNKMTSSEIRIGTRLIVPVY